MSRSSDYLGLAIVQLKVQERRLMCDAVPGSFLTLLFGGHCGPKAPPARSLLIVYHLTVSK